MDKKIAEIIKGELQRQRDCVELIASENYVSPQILAITGSVLTNKYAEGYPGKRYYGGCEWVDKAETLAIERLTKLFKCNYANVQAHSGSTANLAAYAALLQPGDTVLAMSLAAGGHLTHGHKVSFSGICYHFHHYGVDKIHERIDMEEVRTMALRVKPKLIVAGASNYSRIIDFASFRAIADEVGALLMVDMAHIAGLVAGGVHPSPFPHAHVVTSTTHKTLAGPRGAIILSNEPAIAQKIDKAVFPGMQGGPLMHVIAAKAAAFGEASEPAFAAYAKAVVVCANAFAEFFIAKGRRVVAGGTDNHLFTIDVMTSYNKTGSEAETLLAKVNITVNKNAIPFDKLPPGVTSGVRIGTPAMTTRGFSPREFLIVAEVIDSVLVDESAENIAKQKAIIVKLLKRFEIYPEL